MSKFVFKTYYPNSHAYPTVVNDYVMNKNLLLDKFQSNCSELFTFSGVKYLLYLLHCFDTLVKLYISSRFPLPAYLNFALR